MSATARTSRCCRWWPVLPLRYSQDVAVTNFAGHKRALRRWCMTWGGMWDRVAIQALNPPRKVVAAPRKVVAAPRRVVAAPRKVVAVPGRVVAAPKKVVAVPGRVVEAPRKVVAASRRVVAAPRKVVAASRRVVAAPRRVETAVAVAVHRQPSVWPRPV
eukprot:349651-Chlamydomonas_euryale.AAC.2